jgi:nucleoside-diphosphate-sugar epimerase
VRILIIGGTGLISTEITRQLLERGENVTHYNRGQSPVRVPGEVRHISGDRRDFAAFEARMREEPPFDCVIDMICYKPQEAESLLRAFAGRTGHLVVCSTVDVYTKPAARYPVREEEPFGGIGAYAIDKVSCEKLLWAAHTRGDVAVTVLRPAYTYGEGRAILHSFGGRSTTIDRIRKGKPILVHGDGSSLWVSCHSEDVARGFLGAAGNPRAFGRAYNVAGEEPMTWNQHHEQVAEALGAPKPVLVHIPTDLLAQAVPNRARAIVENFQFPNIFDNSAAKSDLGFRYTLPWVEGVRRTLAYYEANHGIESSDAEPWYDRLIDAWERLGEAMARETGELDA